MDDDRTRLSSSDDPTVLSSSDDAPTVLSPFSHSSGAPAASISLEAGQSFGPYTINRVLGRGGMGEVYEADHVETGRRVALKLLRGSFVQHEDRARFLQEGRLAASVSHPHTVYIFGSEEIDGQPVISMQLLPGGTLKDRVVENGPMAPSAAVAAVLDVISGLDAAEAAGILHRDIKPSNCFVDSDGSVKVGDFGLSISTNARESKKGAHGFQGTPQYAPPEQLRGEPLDVRADIYAVGATLFYLLTGRAPFEAKEFPELVDLIKNSPPPLAHKIRPGIPAALSAVVVRCLAKDPSKRPASYSEVARLLRPFSGSTVPARRGLRLIAGAIDALLLAMPASLVRSGTLHVVTRNASVDVHTDAWAFLLSFAYYAVAEGVWATTIGKRICGLRVISTTGEMTWRQGALRSLIFNGSSLPVVALALVFGRDRFAAFLTAHIPLAVVAGLGPVAITAALFATMRRKNGLATIHDLVTRTRVVQRKARELRRAATLDSPEMTIGAAAEAAARFGQYEVVKSLGEIPGGRLFEGADPVLRRRVWLIEWPAGTPEVSRARRGVDRVGRLHWLAGRRSPGENGENWDAFEAPQGAPVDPSPGGSPWSSVQGWLNDIATELAAARRDATTPGLALDRLWIRPDGRAVLLEFPPPPKTTSGVVSAETTPDVVFLASVARLAVANRTGSQMPVSAVAMVDRWTKKQATLSLADAQADLAAISIAAERVSRGRRFTPLVISAAPLILMLVITIVAVRTIGRNVPTRMTQTLALLREMEKETSDHQRAIATYLAGTMHDQLVDDAAWDRLTGKDDEISRLRDAARTTAALQPAPAEIAAAEEKIRPLLDKVSSRNNATDPVTIFMALALTGAGMSFLGGLVSVLLRPSGFAMSALGLAVVAKSGREVSRFRAVLRLLAAWSPMLMLCALVAIPKTRPWMMGSMVPAGISVALMAIGLVWTILRPTRGPHDILARTTIGVR